MNRHGLDYPSLDAEECQVRVRLYNNTVEHYSKRIEHLVRHLPPVFSDWIQVAEAVPSIERVGAVELLVLPASYERFQADGFMSLIDVPAAVDSFTPLPVVFANEPLLIGNSSGRRVMLRHESVHIEQVIRGDYFTFVNNEEQRAIARDPSGAWLCSGVLGGKSEAIADFARRRFLQDVYNEGEAYAREELEFSHRVNFWEAWTDVLMRAADYWGRYSLWKEFTSPGEWLASFETTIRSVMTRTKFYKTRYVRGNPVSFLAVLRSGTLEDETVTFRSGLPELSDIVVRVPPAFLRNTT